MKSLKDIRPLAVFFVVSGCCGLAYEIVWLRLAMARFGVNTALISIFLSLFMAGLGLGSWLAGYLTRRNRSAGPGFDLKLYALSELMIAAGGLATPSLLSWGQSVLARSGADWASGAFYFASAACIALAIVPWCAFMGATIPLAMSAIGKAFPDRSERSFSFLYVANVLGAFLGTVLSAFVAIELLGFTGTGRLMAMLNVLLALAAWLLSEKLSNAPGALKNSAAARRPVRASADYGLLFMTGFTAMAMEIVWTRQLIPFLGLHVYAFAAILALYLLAYNLGSYAYRRTTASSAPFDPALVWAATAFCGALAMIAGDPRLPLGGELGGGILRLYLCVAPFSAATGFLTPMIVDRFSLGNPELAGKGYAVNVLGCILGPLAASFALLPNLSERWVEAVLLLAFCAAGLTRARASFSAAAAFGILLLAFFTADFESRYRNPVVLRDSSATVIAAESGTRRLLIVNGSLVTAAVPVTKFMAHLPLVFLDHPAHDALVICFGMGTTFRSLLSWGIRTTAVELAPSVLKLFPLFHSDGAELMKSRRARIVIDDGRRFLARSREQFDVITIDPAPPIEGMGNSLLYSREFYALAKTRLRPDGILQQWYWRETMDRYVLASALSALTKSFREVRVFPIAATSATIGFHILASDRPIPRFSTKELAKRLPAAAAKDFLEWGPEYSDVEKQFGWLLSGEMPADALLASLSPAPPLTDDLPRNEYHLLRDIQHLGSAK